MTFVEDYLKREGGNNIHAAIACTRDLMRGDVRTHKAGYTRRNAVLAAAELFKMSPAVLDQSMTTEDELDAVFERLREHLSGTEGETLEHDNSAPGAQQFGRYAVFAMYEDNGHTLTRCSLANLQDVCRGQIKEAGDVECYFKLDELLGGEEPDALTVQFAAETWEVEGEHGDCYLLTRPDRDEATAKKSLCRVLTRDIDERLPARYSAKGTEIMVNFDTEGGEA